jgi:D-alanyl-D-alanine carboxypeptidase
LAASVARRTLATLVLVCCAAAARAAGPAEAAVTDAYPGAAAAYVLAIDGRVWWARAADQPRAPASLTKLLTALVLLDSGWNERRWLPVSAAAAAIEGKRIGLRRGERVRAGEALDAMLVASGNDACLALVEDAGGVGAFVVRMNQRARSLGLNDSNFVQPCGLDAPAQHSTPADLLRLARAVLEVEPIRHRVALLDAKLRTEAGRVIAFRNSNALLGRLAGADGVKTGQTRRAGRCLIAHVRRAGHEVLLVLLDAHGDRWWTAAALIEEALRAARAGG